MPELNEQTQSTWRNVRNINGTGYTPRVLYNAEYDYKQFLIQTQRNTKKKYPREEKKIHI